MTTDTLDPIARVIHHVARHPDARPSLDDLARLAGQSRFAFERAFRKAVGLPPLRFVQMVALAEGKRFLAEGRSLLETSLSIGLSGPSRLHDLFVTVDAVTPGDFKVRGRGLEIAWGTAPSPFGTCLVGHSPRGICWFTFVRDEASGLRALRAAWPDANFRRDPGAAARTVARCFASRRASGPLRLFVRGTNFQTKVWKALVDIPEGAVASYGDVARAIGQPGATRAVGTACGKNPIGLLIPCHRVIRETGALGHYGFGTPTKRALLAYELARAGRQPADVTAVR